MIRRSVSKKLSSNQYLPCVSTNIFSRNCHQPHEAVFVVLKLHMHLTQYINQVCIICSSVKVTLCPPTSSVDGVCTCTTPSTHISVDLVIVL